MNTTPYEVDTRSAEFQRGVDLVREYQKYKDAKLADEHPLARRLRRCLSKRRAARGARAMSDISTSYGGPWQQRSGYLLPSSLTLGKTHANTTLFGTITSAINSSTRVASPIL